tara:strand:- start:282 stop:467 length:186 start_codon:yes stop_codon:yes gene_type:complete
MKMNLEDKNMKIELNRKEIKLINEACEFFMDELKEDSTFENPNNKKFYDLWDIRNKITQIK